MNPDEHDGPKAPPMFGPRPKLRVKAPPNFVIIERAERARIAAATAAAHSAALTAAAAAAAMGNGVAPTEWMPIAPPTAPPVDGAWIGPHDRYGNRLLPPPPPREAPLTEAPPTEAPTTEAPTTEAPPTEAPLTEAPAIEAPTTEAPPTEAPSTEAPMPRGTSTWL